MHYSYYEIDHLGKMTYLKNLACFCSSENHIIDAYSLSIEIETTEQNTAKELHPYIHLVLKEISNLDKIAKDKLAKLYNPTSNELKMITVNHISFETNKSFNLFYNLPQGSGIEYLSVKFSKDNVIIDSSGGNY